MRACSQNVADPKDYCGDRLSVCDLLTAIIYITTQAGSLPTFMPGYAAGSARIHSTHALAAAIVAVVLFIIGWAVGRSRA